MNTGYSVLQNITRADIRHAPFAHIIIENCLPPDLYARLEASYPDDDAVLTLGEAAKDGPVRPNSRHDIGAYRLLGSKQVASVWRDFVAWHVSRPFFREFAGLMEAEIVKTHPALTARFGARSPEWTTAVRYDPTQFGQVALDCHVGINTPSNRRTSVRRVHTDAPDELFAMLLYFRRDGDDATGGDLEIFRWRKGREKRFIGSEVDERDVEHVHTVPYRANTLVAFLNSDDALHAVSRRAPSCVSRRLVNIMGRVRQSAPEGLFVKRQKNDPLSLLRRTVQRYNIATGRF